MPIAPTAALAGAALVGGGLALGGAAALGRLGAKTTIQEVTQTPVSSASNASFAPSSRALTIEEVYRRAAPGVVQITATSVQTQTDPFGFFPPTTHVATALGSGFV